MPKFLLPGGRGEIHGANAEQLRDEDYRQRGEEVPGQNAWWASIIGPSAQHGLVSDTSANEVRFLLMEPLTQAFVGKYARIRVFTADAGAPGFEAAIYRLDPDDGGGTLIEMPNSRVSFNVGSAGWQSKELSGDLQLYAGNPYYLGVWTEGTALEINGMERGTTLNTPTRVRYQSNTSVPTSAKIEGMTWSSVKGVPAVLYLSEEGNRFL